MCVCDLLPPFDICRQEAAKGDDDRLNFHNADDNDESEDASCVGRKRVPFTRARACVCLCVQKDVFPTEGEIHW